ncbi:glucosaminidase domain-containing protein [Streptococcus castoreus]|uniref:glucosaminidase domain-containing protein n=1 Tax=Streptococcus castoreus TaxID=254786 RepID=UPI0003F936FA|nr:glucosaminidase domain-containing protein [Streptococcus castoreus]
MRSRLKFPYFVVLLLFFWLLVVIPLLFSGRMATANQEVKSGDTQAQFIKKISTEVKPLANSYGIRPSVLIGQILLETNYGKTLLATKYNNLFSKEAVAGQASVTLKSPKNRNVKYAIYKDRDSSIRDYLVTLSQGKKLDKRLYRSLATEKGYKIPAQSLQEYYYSGDNNYAQKLIRVIESKDLTRYDY